jgi:hypothetical protein
VYHVVICLPTVIFELVYKQGKGSIVLKVFASTSRDNAGIMEFIQTLLKLYDDLKNSLKFEITVYSCDIIRSVFSKVEFLSIYCISF